MRISPSRRLATALVVGLLALSGCTSGGSTDAAEPEQASDESTMPAALKANVADDAADVAVDTLVSVTVQHGKVDQAALKSTDGKLTVPGEVTDDGWLAGERLEPGTDYRLDVTATGEDGESQKLARTFTTQNLTLQQQTYATMAPIDGATVGVGMPIVVNFDVPVTDKATFEKHLKVTSTPQVTGSWNWFSDTEVHYRPKEYWPAGTKVKVRLDINGLPAGDGVYGQHDVNADFTIGRKVVNVVNVSAHRLRHTVDGKTVKTLKMSAGDDGHRTREGVKVIMEKLDTVDMDAASTGVDSDDPGYYNQKGVKWAMRLTNSGEFIHAAPWNAGYMGNANMSHGCTGLLTDDASWLYQRTHIGDVVKYTNSPRGLEDRNGWTEWNVPWNEWVEGSALPQGGATPSPSASATPSSAPA